jgi:hypothetical protein
MPIPPLIQELIARLNLELDETEQNVAEGLNLLSPIMERFPNNASLIQFLAYFQTTLFWASNARNRIESARIRLDVPNVNASIVAELGEDLSILLGEILETKIRSENLLNRLRNLQ